MITEACAQKMKYIDKEITRLQRYRTRVLEEMFDEECLSNQQYISDKKYKDFNRSLKRVRSVLD